MTQKGMQASGLKSCAHGQSSCAAEPQLQRACRVEMLKGAGPGVQGGGVASGGLRELIPTVARTAVAVGIDGIFMEVS